MRRSRRRRVAFDAEDAAQHIWRDPSFQWFIIRLVKKLLDDDEFQTELTNKIADQIRLSWKDQEVGEVFEEVLSKLATAIFGKWM